MSKNETTAQEAQDPLDVIAATLAGIHAELARIAAAVSSPEPWNVSIR